MQVTKIEATAQQRAVVRYAAYARVSRNTEDQLQSFASQLRYYNTLFNDSSSEILVELYADEGLTGTDLEKRTDFKRMMADARQHKFDRIICKSVTRFARNTKDCLSAIRELKSLGITVYFEENKIDTMAVSGEVLITLLGLSAQNESVSISKNERWSIRNRMANGTYVAYPAPFGYKFEGKTMKIMDERAEIVRKIYSDFLNGTSVERIAKELTEKTDRKWSSSAVRCVLTNEKYTGDSVFQKNYTTDTLPFTVKRNKGEVPMYHVSNTHEGIISKEDYNKVQELIKLKGRHTRGKISSPRPLTKMMRCGECGSVFRKIENRDKISWECYDRNHSKKSCSIQRIPEETIYDAFIRLFNKLKANYRVILNPVIYQLEKLRAKQKTDNVQAMQIQSEIIAVREQNYQLSRLNSLGIIADDVYAAQRRELDGKLNRYKQELLSVSSSDDTDNIIEQISFLVSVLESEPYQIGFNPVLFEQLVKSITVISNDTLRFTMFGNIEFNEEIKKGRRRK